MIVATPPRLIAAKHCSATLLRPIASKLKSTPSPSVMSLDLRDRVASGGVDRVSGAELPCQCELVLVQVDGDDLLCSRDPRALDRRQANAAGAKDSHGAAVMDLGGIHRRAGAGHHAATDQRRFVQGHLVVDVHQRVLVDQGVLGVGREVGELGDRVAVPGEARIFVRTPLGFRAAAKGRSAAEAVGAVAAEDRETHDHVVAGLELLDQVTDFLDDPRGLVSENAGRLEGVEPFDKVQIGMADAGGSRLDQYLTRAGLGDISTSSIVKS